MAEFPKEGVSGELADAVTLVLAGETTLRCEKYSVHSAIIQQPAAFSLTLSAGKVLTSDLITKYPPGTPFWLEVGGKRQFVGRIDGWDADGPSGSTSLNVKGRDLLSTLFDNDIAAEQSFTNVTYADIVKEAMKACGVQDFKLLISNEDNRTIKSGVGVVKAAVPAPEAKKPPPPKPKPLTGASAELDALYKDFSAPAKPVAYAADVRALKFKETKPDETAKNRISSGSGAAVKYVVHAKLGESWLDFIKRHLKKAGLYLWTAHDGSFVLATPAKNQKATCLFVRQRGQSSNICNVTDAKFTNDTSKRFSEVIIYARGLGRKHGRTKIHSGFVDEEMLALGLHKLKVYRDVNVTNAEQAEFYARCRIAEANRGAWKLQYTFSGHTAPTLNPGERAIPVPDTVAHVEDDELGIHRDLYIESVSFQSPPRTTTVTMMRLEDIVFEDDQERGKSTGLGTPGLKGTVLPEGMKVDTRNPIDVLGLRNGTFGLASDVPGADARAIDPRNPRQPTSFQRDKLPPPIPTGNPKLGK